MTDVKLLDRLLDVEAPGLWRARDLYARSPAFLRTLVVATPCVFMTNARLPNDRRATAAELRAWQDACWASAIPLVGSFFQPGGDA